MPLPCRCAVLRSLPALLLAALPACATAPIGATGFGVARHPIEGGAHTIVITRRFGIVVYAYGQYTSYMDPGGLDLQDVVVVPS